MTTSPIAVQVKVNIARDTDTAQLVPVVGRVEFTPLRRRTDASGAVVLPQSVTVELTPESPAPVVSLVQDDAETWAWSRLEHLTNGDPTARAFTLVDEDPDGDPVEYSALALIDPTFLTPVPETPTVAAALELKADKADLGTAAARNADEFATVDQGALAETAIQPATLTSALEDKADLVAGKVPTSQIPALAVTEFLGEAADEAAMLALTGQTGDWCIRQDQGTTWIITGPDPSSLTDWTQLAYPAPPVSSVNGQVGAVVLGKGDVGLEHVNNTADTDKPVSTAQATAINARLPRPAQTTASWTGTVDVSALVTDERFVHATLTGNVTISSLPTPTTGGHTVTLILTQDGTGGRTLTLPSGVLRAQGIAPALSTAAGAKDILHLMWTGNRWVILAGAMAVS